MTNALEPKALRKSFGRTEIIRGIDLVVRQGERVGKPSMIRYGVSREEAARFGLPCGGTLRVVQEPLGDAGWAEAVLPAAASPPTMCTVLLVELPNTAARAFCVTPGREFGSVRSTGAFAAPARSAAARPSGKFWPDAKMMLPLGAVKVAVATWAAVA